MSVTARVSISRSDSPHECERDRDRERQTSFLGTAAASSVRPQSDGDACYHSRDHRLFKHKHGNRYVDLGGADLN